MEALQAPYDTSQIGRLGERGKLVNAPGHPSECASYDGWEQMVKSLGLPRGYSGGHRVEDIRQAMLGVPAGMWVGPQGKMFTSYDDLEATVGEMRKALATTTIAGFGDGTPLRLENLDPVITTILWQTAHFRLFRWLPHEVSAQVQFDWNRRLDYGGGRSTGGFAEGGGPAASTGSYQRNNVLCRHYGVRRGTTLTAQLTSRLGGFHVDAIREENENGTKALLAKIERGLVFGHEGVNDQNGVAVNYRGLWRYMATGGASHYINMAGANLTFHDIEAAAALLVQDGFVPSMEDGRVAFFMTPDILRDMSRQKLSADFKILTGASEAPKSGYVGGIPFTGYATNFGYVPFVNSIFMQAVQGNQGLAAADTGAPAAPASVIADAGGGTEIAAGTYRYWVSAINDSGETIATAATGNPLVLAAATRVSVTITQVANATSYRIYRSVGTAGSATMANARWIATVPDSGAGTTVYTDSNQVIPGTGIAFMISGIKDAFTVAELAPLMKWMLYPSLNTTQEFILLLIHALATKAWERCIFWFNVGSYVEP